MCKRESALKEWLAGIIKQEDFILTPLFGDASFRRYFRIEYNGLTQIVMDAPPEKENLASFIHMARKLAAAQVLTPEIIAQEPQQGFLLLSDFGDHLLLGSLNPETANNYYSQAMQSIFKMQTCSTNDPMLPSFSTAFMLQEMNLCTEWFFKAYLALELQEKEQLLINKTMAWIATEVAHQPQVFIHRDFHSRNLMLVDKQSLGVIDFQDAMCGPVTYDLVSLLKDCYIAWPRAKLLEWLGYFHTHNQAVAHYSLAELVRAFDLCGVQRHLKVLGVFCRLQLRDNKPGYLKDLPLTLNYVLECTESYNELRPLHDFLQDRVKLP
ncbi:MAG: aminoglycoside phosphotransferase family protein [Legionellales bacterium]